MFRWFTLGAALTVLGLILVRSRPPEVDVDPEASRHLAEKLQAVDEALARSEPARLEINEAELNVWAAENLAIDRDDEVSPAEVKAVQGALRDLRIKLIDDRLQAHAIFELYRQRLSLVLEGTLGARDGYLRFTPMAGRLGSLPLTQGTLDRAVARLFDSPEHREKLRLPAHIADVTVEGGQLVFSYR